MPTIGMFGISRRDALPAGPPDALPAPPLTIEDPAQTAPKAAAALRAEGAQVVLMFSALGDVTTRRLITEWDASVTPPPEVVLMSGSSPPKGVIEWVDTTLLFEPLSADQTISLLQAHMPPDGAPFRWADAAAQRADADAFIARAAEVAQAGQRLNPRSTTRSAQQVRDDLAKLFGLALSQPPPHLSLRWRRVPLSAASPQAPDVAARVEAFAPKAPPPKAPPPKLPPPKAPKTPPPKAPPKTPKRLP